MTTQTRRKPNDRQIHDVATVSALTLSATVFAQGTADQAKAMLTKAVAAVKADKAKELDEFNNGTGGFLQGDLYVFCFNVGDRKVVVLGNPNAKQLMGTDELNLKDSNGKEFGREQFAPRKNPKGSLRLPITCFQDRVPTKRPFRRKASPPRSVIWSVASATTSKRTDLATVRYTRQPVRPRPLRRGRAAGRVELVGP